MKKPILALLLLSACGGGDSSTVTSTINSCSVTIVPNKASLQELMDQVELTGGELIVPPDVSIQESDAPIEIILCSSGIVQDNNLSLDGTLALAKLGAYYSLEVMP